jgi:hypothetical protein
MDDPQCDGAAVETAELSASDACLAYTGARDGRRQAGILENDPSSTQGMTAG